MEWIRITDRLPLPDVDVIVRMPFFANEHLFTVLALEEGRWVDYLGEPLRHDGYVVTHWMPLPKPPTK